MQLSGRGIVIKNTDTADWPSVTMKVNLTQWGSDDGRADIGPVAMGRAVTVPYGEFTVGTKRFSPRETKILTIYVKSGDGSAKLFLCPGTTCIESPK